MSPKIIVAHSSCSSLTLDKLFWGLMNRAKLRPGFTFSRSRQDKERASTKKKMSYISAETDKTLKFVTLAQDRSQLWQKKRHEFINSGIKEMAQVGGLPCVSRCHRQAIV